MLCSSSRPSLFFFSRSISSSPSSSLSHSLSLSLISNLLSLTLYIFTLQDVVSKTKPNFIVHAAAERRPDQCSNNEEGTMAMNVLATKYMTEAANEHGATLLYISTDYVFDGTSPPYTPSDNPNPLNFYGKSKLAGEEACLEVGKDSFVLRVPILYGPVEYIEESAITIIGTSLLSSKPSIQDNWAQRFPTHVQDVASVCLSFASSSLSSSPSSSSSPSPSPYAGKIFHFGGNEQHTKYTIALLMAKLLGKDSSHLSPSNDPTPGASRPQNAQLDSSDVEKLGFYVHTPLAEGLAEALKPFF